MLRVKLVDSPQDLIDFTARDIRNFPTAFRFRARVINLRKAARIDSNRTAKRQTNTRLSRKPGLLARSIRGNDIADSAFPKQHGRTCDPAKRLMYYPTWPNRPRFAY